MTNTSMLFVVFGLFYGVLFIVRNIYYFKLWRYRSYFDNEEQRAKVFGLGLKKFMLPIPMDEKISDPLLKETIKMVNIFNYLAILSFILVFVAFFYN